MQSALGTRQGQLGLGEMDDRAELWCCSLDTGEHTVLVPTGHAGITRGSSLQPPPKIHFAKANATLALQEAAVLFVCDLL